MRDMISNERLVMGIGTDLGIGWKLQLGFVVGFGSAFWWAIDDLIIQTLFLCSTMFFCQNSSSVLTQLKSMALASYF